MSKQRFLDIALLILVATLLVAGGGCVSIPTSPATALSPTSPCPSTGGIRVSLATPQPADVLLELAWEGGLTRPELGFAFGRVPDFSLLPDGNVYYLDPAEWDKSQVMTAHLAPAETEALIQRVLDLGFERLESYTDPCQPQGGGTCLCVADAGESVLRVRLQSGELREIRNYYDFANDPEALTAIRSLLQDYQQPAATPYAPEKAAIFARSVAPPSDLPILDWPLPPSWLAGGTPDAACVRALAETDLQALLAVTGRNTGDFYFRTGDQIYNVYLAPWLPGVDYADLIASSGQACPPAEEPAVQKSSNVQPAPSASDPHDGWHEYTNPDYGFSFRFPLDWALEERPHQLILRHKAVDTLRFKIAYRGATEDVGSSRTGMPAGDFVTRGSVPCLGRNISRDVLVYKGKAKLVLYNYSSAIPWGDLVFGLILEDIRGDYETVNLPEDIQRQVDRVVSSLELTKHWPEEAMR